MKVRVLLLDLQRQFKKELKRYNIYYIYYIYTKMYLYLNKPFRFMKNNIRYISRNTIIPIDNIENIKYEYKRY